MIASIVIEPTGVRGERGCRYRVLYGGEIMIWIPGAPNSTPPGLCWRGV